jgi:hypothetical protein
MKFASIPRGCFGLRSRRKWLSGSSRGPQNRGVLPVPRRDDPEFSCSQTHWDPLKNSTKTGPDPQCSPASSGIVKPLENKGLRRSSGNGSPVGHVPEKGGFRNVWLPRVRRIFRMGPCGEDPGDFFENFRGTARHGSPEWAILSRDSGPLPSLLLPGKSKCSHRDSLRASSFLPSASPSPARPSPPAPLADDFHRFTCPREPGNGSRCSIRFWETVLQSVRSGGIRQPA